MPEGSEGAGEGTTPTPSAGEKTFTQEQLDRIVEERLKRERAKYSDYDDLKAKADQAESTKSEAQKALEKAEQLEKKLAESDARALKAEVAQAKGLTPGQAKRLSGSTKEELESDADDLLEAFGSKKDPEGGKAEGETTDDGKTGDGQGQDGGGKAPAGRSKEKLTSGAAPDEGDDSDPSKVADQVLGNIL